MTNFWKGLAMVEQTQPKEHVYRLYYDIDTGMPLFYSMSDQPGNYINITKAEYDISNYHILVIDKKIKPLNTQGYRKLTPAESGTACHPSNVMIVDTNNSKYWSVKTYELE